MTFLVLIVPCEGGGRAVKVETVTERSELAGRGRKKGRADYRLRETSGWILCIGVTCSASRSYTNWLILRVREEVDVHTCFQLCSFVM